MSHPSLAFDAFKCQSHETPGIGIGLPKMSGTLGLESTQNGYLPTLEAGRRLSRFHPGHEAQRSARNAIPKPHTVPAAAFLPGGRADFFHVS